MYVSYSNGEKRIVYIPQDQKFEFLYVPFNGENDSEAGIYLLVGETKYSIRDMKYWVNNDVDYCTANYLHCDLIGKIKETLSKNVTFIDVDVIESELIDFLRSMVKNLE